MKPPGLQRTSLPHCEKKTSERAGTVTRKCSSRSALKCCGRRRYCSASEVRRDSETSPSVHSVRSPAKRSGFTELQVEREIGRRDGVMPMAAAVMGRRFGRGDRRLHGRVPSACTKLRQAGPALATSSAILCATASNDGADAAKTRGRTGPISVQARKGAQDTAMGRNRLGQGPLPLRDGLRSPQQRGQHDGQGSEDGSKKPAKKPPANRRRRWTRSPSRWCAACWKPPSAK